MIGINLLAMAGLPRLKDEMIVLLSNRHLALEKYQAEMVWATSTTGSADHPMLRALRNANDDARYPPWSNVYVRDVAAAQARTAANALDAIVAQAMPAQYVSDPAYDFGVHETGIKLLDVLSGTDPAKIAPLDNSIAELLGNFGAHSRNAIRGILKAGGLPPLPNPGNP